MIDELSKRSYLSRKEVRAEIERFVGVVCEEILKDTAVFKDDEKGKDAFLTFMKKAGFNKM
jgi:galactose-1-phosphate uridylyltransferase